MMKVVENGFLPARYHLEVYEHGLMSDPVHSAQSKSPFPVPMVGHYLDGRSLEQQATSHKLKVVEVHHIYWTIQNSHVSHKLMIVVQPEQD